MFLVPIKLRLSKFSLYLILLGFLVPIKIKLNSVLVPSKFKFV